MPPPSGHIRPCGRSVEPSRPTRDGAPRSSRPTNGIAKHIMWAHTVRPSSPSAANVDRAGAQYPQGVRRIRKRQSRQRLRCVRPYTRYTAHQRKARRPLPHNEQRFNLQVPAASRSEAGRAAADVYSKAKDGGTLSRYLLLCESHRRRVRSTKPNLHTGLLKLRRVLGFLGGSESGLCPPAGG